MSHNGTPPYDADAEQAVIGSLLIDNDTFEDVARLVGAGDFYLNGNRRIFEAAAAEIAAGRSADAVTMTAALEASGQLEAIGGADALVELLEKVPTAANAEHYARIVADRARRRRIIEAAERAAQRAADLTADDAEIATALEAVAAAGNGAWRGGAEAVLVKMADVAPEPVRWVWPWRVPLGKLTLFAGDPGLGKSLLSLDIAARVTRGAHWPGPDAAGEPAPLGNVILLSAEDDKADTIRPRLDAAGADVERIVVLDSVRERGGERGFTLADLPILSRAIEDTGGVNLVVIDPLSAYLGGVDSHRNAEVRSRLGPLKALAEARGVAVAAVTHLCKGGGQSALYRAMGSLGFVAAARAYWVLSRDGDDPKRVLMLPGKQNLAPDVGGLAFRVEDSPDSPGVPVLAWESSAVTVPVDEVLASCVPADRETRRERDEAADWLRGFLAGGPVPKAEVVAAAKSNRHAWHTVRRAADSIGVEHPRDGFGRGSKVLWKLPDGA